MPRQPSIEVSNGPVEHYGGKHTTGAGTSVVGTASELESSSDSSSSESSDSSDELDSGVGSLTTFLDFFLSCKTRQTRSQVDDSRESMKVITYLGGGSDGGRGSLGRLFLLLLDVGLGGSCGGCRLGCFSHFE